MMNPFAETDWNPGTAARRAFGRSLVIGFLLLALMLLLIKRWLSGHWLEWPLWMAGIGAAVGVICWTVPAVAKPFYVAWYALGCSIGIVVANLVVALIYYLIFTPMGLLLRALGKDPLERRFQPAAKTYWKDVPASTDKARYFQQF